MGEEPAVGGWDAAHLVNVGLRLMKDSVATAATAGVMLPIMVCLNILLIINRAQHIVVQHVVRHPATICQAAGVRKG